jgi:hypothetical protein
MNFPDDKITKFIGETNKKVISQNLIFNCTYDAPRRSPGYHDRLGYLFKQCNLGFHDARLPPDPVVS